MMSLKSKRDLRALVEARYKQTQELEKKLHAALVTNGPAKPQTRDIRNTLREGYENIILTDHEFAELHDVEYALWRLNYKRIEEFRSRIKRLPSASSTPSQGETKQDYLARRLTMQKLVAVFRSFLAEASGFYHELISKLKTKHGLPQDFSFSDAELHNLTASAPAPGGQQADIQRCQVSCHRCLIYLGDLARYKELVGDGDAASRDWSAAAAYYVQAASIWPASGNPHNQLAVLATYVDDELLAVYRYYRSLAVEVPFSTARENLTLLFEKNRLRYAELPQPGEYPSAGGKVKNRPARPDAEDEIIATGQADLKLAVKKKNSGQQVQDLLLAKIPELRKSFRIRFVRLNGIIFTKISSETFDTVFQATMRELEDILSLDDMNLEAGLGSEHRSGIGSSSGGAVGVVQMVALFIFTAHNVSWSPDAHQPTYAEVLQRSELLELAFSALFECSGRIVRRIANTENPLQCSLMPAMLVVLEWLASHSAMATGSDIRERQAKARLFFWGQSADLLNLLLDKESAACSEAHWQGSSALLLQVPGKGVKWEGRPLWEDHELRGFQPLAPSHKRLDFTQYTARHLSSDAEQQQVRLRRLVAAGLQLAAIFKGSKQGILFSEEHDRFSVIGRSPASRAQVNHKQAGLGNASPQETGAEMRMGIRDGILTPMDGVASVPVAASPSTLLAAKIVKPSIEAVARGQAVAHPRERTLVPFFGANSGPVPVVGPESVTNQEVALPPVAVAGEQPTGLGLWDGVDGGLEEGLDDGAQLEDGGDAEPAWANEDGRSAPLTGEEEKQQKQQRAVELEQIRQMKQKELQLSRLLGEDEEAPLQGQNSLADGLADPAPLEHEETEDEEVIVFQPSAEQSRRYALPPKMADAQPAHVPLLNHVPVLVPSPSPLVVAALGNTGQNASPLNTQQRPALSSLGGHTLPPTSVSIPVSVPRWPNSPGASALAGPSAAGGPSPRAQWHTPAIPEPSLWVNGTLPLEEKNDSPPVGVDQAPVGLGAAVSSAHANVTGVAPSLGWQSASMPSGMGGQSMDAYHQSALAAGSTGLDLGLLSSLLGLQPPSRGTQSGPGQSTNASRPPSYQSAKLQPPSYPLQGGGAGLDSLLGALSAAPGQGQAYHGGPGQEGSQQGGPPSYPPGSLGDLATRLYSSYGGSWDSLGFGQPQTFTNLAQTAGQDQAHSAGNADAYGSQSRLFSIPQDQLVQHGEAFGYQSMAMQNPPWSAPPEAGQHSVGGGPFQNGLGGRTNSGFGAIGTAAGGPGFFANSPLSGGGHPSAGKVGSWAGPDTSLSARGQGLPSQGPSLGYSAAAGGLSPGQAAEGRPGSGGGSEEKYAWMDEFTHVKPQQNGQWALQDKTASSLWGGQGLPGSGARPGSWLGAAGLAGGSTPSPLTTSLGSGEWMGPFPGMRSPQQPQDLPCEPWQTGADEQEARREHQEPLQLWGGDGRDWNGTLRTPHVP